MAILRIILVVALIAGCVYVVTRAPWKARLDPTPFTAELPDAPLWAKPEAPGIGVFEQFHKVPEGTEIVVILNRRKIFAMLSVVVVGLFFAFGLAGTIIQKRPDSSDVAFSLWLSLGLLGGVAASALIGQASGHQFSFFPECLLAGFVTGLLICIRSRARLPAVKSGAKE